MKKLNVVIGKTKQVSVINEILWKTCENRSSRRHVPVTFSASIDRRRHEQPIDVGEYWKCRQIDGRKMRTKRLCAEHYSEDNSFGYANNVVVVRNVVTLNE